MNASEDANDDHTSPSRLLITIITRGESIFFGSSHHRHVKMRTPLHITKGYPTHQHPFIWNFHLLSLDHQLLSCPLNLYWLRIYFAWSSNIPFFCLRWKVELKSCCIHSINTFMSWLWVTTCDGLKSTLMFMFITSKCSVISMILLVIFTEGGTFFTRQVVTRVYQCPYGNSILCASHRNSNGDHQPLKRLPKMMKKTTFSLPLSLSYIQSSHHTFFSFPLGKNFLDWWSMSWGGNNVLLITVLNDAKNVLISLMIGNCCLERVSVRGCSWWWWWWS